jgi:hypothetical protein
MSASQLNSSLSTIDAVINLTQPQKAALDELEKVAKTYSDNMSRVWLPYRFFEIASRI